MLINVMSLASFSSNPADGDNLYILTKTSIQPMVFSLDNLDKITFTENGINLWNTSWPTRYSYDNFLMMSFKELKSDAILLKKIESADVNITYDKQSNFVRVSGTKRIDAIIVYDLHGYLVASNRFPSSPCEVSLSHTSRGIYVVHVYSEGNVIAKQKIVK